MKSVTRLFTVVIVLSATTLFTAHAQKKEAKKTAAIVNSFNASAAIEKLVIADSARLVDMFKDIHANPELGFMEVRTAGIVAKELTALGFNVKTGIGVTGVVGILQNGEGPIVMYRADMDCNAVKEVTNLPYASKKLVKREDGSETPVMHACGHDAHTTWLIGLAKIMVSLKDKWKGTLVLVGQPAEEPILGAEAMVKDGMYDKGVPKPDYLLGIHTAPVSVGIVAVAKGVRMAGTDQIDVTFKGVGGHGSNPQMSKDPVVMAASAIMQYQAVVSRAIDPQKAAVLTVGSVQAGSDNNVIPASALVKVNLRWFDEKDRQLMIDGIKRINEGIAYAYNMPKEEYPVMTMKGWSYPLDNSEKTTAMVLEGVKKIVPEKYILREDKLAAVMGSEDFHHLVIHNEVKEYCYINVGIANPTLFAQSVKEGKGLPFNAHNGNFWVDLSAIPFGTKVAANAVLQVFNSK
jgi:amidohydrolase